MHDAKTEMNLWYLVSVEAQKSLVSHRLDPKVKFSAFYLVGKHEGMC